MRLALLLALAGADLVGPLDYDRTGVRLDGRHAAWKDVASITETDGPRAAEAFDAASATPEATAAFRKLAEDPRDKDSIRMLRPILKGRPPKTRLRPPFAGRWKAMPDATGHHAQKAFALFAIDFVGVDEKGRLSAGAGKALGDYVGFDQPVLAAADGEVLQVEDRFEDLPPGQLGPPDHANFVTIRHGGDEHSFYGHLRKGSAAVKVGDKVTAGQALGRVGNSGASGTPHLHFTTLSLLNGGWVSVPWRIHGFRLVEAGGTACSIEVKQASPQEGWVLLAPGP